MQEETCNTIYHMLKALAERAPQASAIVAPGRNPLTYALLLEQVEYLAGSLHAIGVGRNDRVAIVLPNGPVMATASLAVAACSTGAPLNPAFRAPEFDFFFSDLRPKALIVQSGTDSPAIAVAQKHCIPIIELLSGARREAGILALKAERQACASQVGLAEAEDVALILHTSGTTSRPKMVPLTQANIVAAARNIGATLKLAETDRCLNVIPLFHIHGIVGALLSSIAAGSTVVCTSGFDAERFFVWLDEFRPTWYTAVPTMHQALLLCAPSYKVMLQRCSLRFIRSSSAVLSPRVMQELEDIFHAPVIEAYGMTEASHQIASNPLPPGKRKAGSVGLSAGAEVAVVDEEGNLLPHGSIGHVVVCGPTITAGYVNDREVNEDRFKERWFRTGDRGYLDADRYLFLTGRVDEAINRGGEKISPAEVDQVLQEHPAVSEAVTFAIPHRTLGQEIVAAVVLRGEASITGAEIQQFVGARLADFKIPRQVLVINSIPKTATGKIQRIGLAEKLGLISGNENETSAKPEFVAPGTETEKKLASVWSSVLGLDVGVHDNFFDLGGDSIQAARIISRVQAWMDAEVSFVSFFTTSTVAAMARKIETAAGESTTSRSAPLQSMGSRGELPLSFAQQRLWFLEQLDPGSPAYNRPIALRLKGQLNVSVLERSLSEIVRRHEVLRTIFPAVNGEPTQVIGNAEPVMLSVTDLKSLPESEKERSATQRAFQEAQRPFDLARGPMMRASLIWLSDKERTLLLTAHHIVFDGWSEGVLLRELSVLYQAFSTLSRSPLPELPIQYADFAVWQRQWFQGEIFEAQLSYWRRQLHGDLPALLLPNDHPRPPVQTFRGARQSKLLSRALTAALRTLSQRENATLFMTLLAAFNVLLQRYTGQDDIIIGTPVAGRTRLESEELIGAFINTLALRTDLSGNPRFRELLARVRQMFLEGYAHQDLPFEKLVERLQPQRDLSRNPVFQVMFQLKNMPENILALPHLKLDKIEFDHGVSRFDLSLEIDARPEGLFCSFEYNTDLFDGATIERVADHFEIVLKGIVANPEQRLSDLPLLTEAERHQLLVKCNHTKTEYPKDKRIHELFEQQVERSGDAVAVVFEDRQLSYRELNQRANQLAHYLKKLGVGPETLVGICVERSLEMIIGLLGILKAGGAYVPLDPEYPKERLRFMLEDTQASVLLTQAWFIEDRGSRIENRYTLSSIIDPRIKVVCLDRDWEEMARESEKNLENEATANNLAYVIYTSGSDGPP